MTVIGGTYAELCFEPSWSHIFGSGLRAVHLLLENDKSQTVNFYTCADKECIDHLRYYEGIYSSLRVFATEIQDSPEFYYDHPLRTPVINPRPDVLCERRTLLEVKDDKVLAFGLIEADIRVDANDVVYDPQSPANPKGFKISGSKAKRLVIIINQTEAKKLSGFDTLDKISDHFFEQEDCYALIVKMGAQGALIFKSKGSQPTKVPVYQTKRVWPIGSGDVFSGFFSLCWFQGRSVEESAFLASKATSRYCNTKDLNMEHLERDQSVETIFIGLTSKKRVYIAGPFFTFTQRWIVNEVLSILTGLNLNVFSPYHDVGLGSAEDVVEKDIAGLDSCDIVFAILDGLDSGTLFEIGYAMSKEKKVIAFAQNVSEESLKMLVGTGCSIENDLTTAVYKTYWSCATT